MPVRNPWRTPRSGVAAVACGLVGLALGAATPAQAAEAPYRWTGTMSVVATHSGPESSGRAEFSGPVTAGFCCGFSLYEPTMTAYHEQHQGTGSWCLSTSDLVPPDGPDTRIPIYIDWGLRQADGSPGVPRMIPSDSVEFSFPRHSFQCLAYGGGELKRYEDRMDGAYRLSNAFYCTVDPYTPPEGLPIAAPFFLPPPLPAREVLGDGSLRFSGSIYLVCDPFAGESARDVRMTVDLVGTPVAQVPASSVVTHRLAVEVRGTQYGSVVGAGEQIACGQGGVTCSADVVAGSHVRLAPLTSTAGRFGMWLGCDQVVGQSCLLTMNGPRQVYAWFGYDFVGQWEPPPDGLFDPARKAEIAGDGASAARSGAVGCGLSAALIGTASGSSVIVAGTAGAATRFQALVEKLFEETVGNCAKGLAGTIFNGVLLKIDPPDPAWRRVALAERFPRAAVGRCTAPRGCAALTRGRRAFVGADARVLELQEALAVAANRYGNAVNGKDMRSQALHQATMRATSGLLAQAYAVRNRAAAALARAITGLGVRKITIPRAVVARAIRAGAAGQGTNTATVARLLRKRLIVRAGEATAILRAHTPKRAVSIDVLRTLRRPVSTAQMRAAGRALTLGDLFLLVEAVTRDTGAPRELGLRLTGQADTALRCDANSTTALRALASMARGSVALNGEGRALLAHAAAEVATHDLTRDEACRA